MGTKKQVKHLTSEKIEFHPSLGVHKTYKGYKWQPSPGDWEVSYVPPGARKFRVFIGSLNQFKRFVNGEIRRAA